MTGGLGLASIPLVLLVPASGPLVGFALVTTWTHGPFAPFIPAAYEPVLMLFGAEYSPLPVAMIGAMSDSCVELLDYGLFRRSCGADCRHGFVSTTPTSGRCGDSRRGRSSRCSPPPSPRSPTGWCG